MGEKRVRSPKEALTRTRRKRRKRQNGDAPEGGALRCKRLWKAGGRGAAGMEPGLLSSGQLGCSEPPGGAGWGGWHGKGEEPRKHGPLNSMLFGKAVRRKLVDGPRAEARGSREAQGRGTGRGAAREQRERTTDSPHLGTGTVAAGRGAPMPPSPGETMTHPARKRLTYAKSRKTTPEPPPRLPPHDFSVSPTAALEFD